MVVSSVQPVVIHGAVFCVACSFVMFVVDLIGEHIVEVYFIIDFTA